MTERSKEELEAREAHRLYWYSDASVNQIAEKLGISKGRLYGFIEPLRSGLACPICATELVYANRTAREQGALHCTECGHEEVEPPVAEDVREAAPRRGPPPGTAAAARRAGPRKEEFPARLVVGGVLVGVAAGVALVGYLRSR